MIGDPTHLLANNFDVLIEEEGVALRGTFVVNPEGEIKVLEIHDNGIGRDASELLRKVKAAQYIDAHPGEVCPAKWEAGATTLNPSLDLVDKIYPDHRPTVALAVLVSRRCACISRTIPHQRSARHPPP